MKRSTLATLAGLLGYSIFGFSFLFSKLALELTTPFVLLSVRFLTAFLVMNLLVLTGKMKLSLRGKPVRMLLLLGLVQPVVYFICENYGIALTSELGETEGEAAEGATQFRIGPMAESVTFTGIVEEICAEENRIWMKLLFDESAPEDAKDSMVCIRWDMLEPISEKITVGITITATGSLSEYQNEASEKNGCAELVLTDTANLEIK